MQGGRKENKNEVNLYVGGMRGLSDPIKCGDVLPP